MEDEDTEIKLAVLASLCDENDPQILLESLLSHHGSVEDAVAELQRRKRLRRDELPQAALQTRSHSSEAQLRWTPKADQDLKRKKESVLELHTIEQISAILPCALFHNVLSHDLANNLLREMLEEATHWTKGFFKLFDRTVSSPHTASFYLKTAEDIEQHRSYIYNGQSLANIKQFTEYMSEAHDSIEQITRDWLRHRDFGYRGMNTQWHANVAFSNLYDGRNSSVGYHSDQLTYLGPLPTIASLSLGCEREFRLKPVNQGRTISIRLPHNSLFIMGPGCQEDYKHSIHPIPTTKGIDMHRIAGDKRINITYRHYRPEYLPELLPRCHCGQTVLRSARMTDKQEEPAAKLALWHGRRYFWHCDGDKVPGQDGCGFFHWARFDDKGRPIFDP